MLFGEAEISDFSDRELLDIFADVPSSTIPRGELEQGIGALSLFTRAGLSKSNSQVLQMIKQGGIYVNNIRIEDSRAVLTTAHLASASVMILRAGKKRYHLVRVEG
jgi:tyrosyl-tRNA synthetase